MSVQYTAIFHGCKNGNLYMKKCEIFLNFAQNIDRWYTEAVLTSTHDLCFRAKVRKNVYPCKPQFYYIKVGCKGVFITRTCLHASSTFLVNGDAYILPYRLHTYLGLSTNGSPY